MKKIWNNNNLSIVLLTFFVLAIIGMSIAGWLDSNEELTQRHQPQLSYGEFVLGGEFIEGVFENWESEFLQMWALVVLTIWLKQKGSEDSKPLRGSAEQDTSSRYSIISAATWSNRAKAIKHALYSHSLSMALFALFIVSFSLHAIGGASAYNEDADYYGTPKVTTFQYISASRFWYESLQNWQSEFLAVASLLLLSIKLRERGSPESKPVGTRFDHKTGK